MNTASPTFRGKRGTDLPDVDDSQNGGKCPDPKMVCRDWFLKDAPEGFDRLGICAMP